MQYLPASATPRVTRGAGTARNDNLTGITQEEQTNTSRRIAVVPGWGGTV